MEKSRRGEKARAAVAALLLLALAGTASGQYPAKPVRFIVPSAAGGGTDIIARALAQKLSESLGAQFVVDNRPGAGQMIGIEMAAKSSADGHTILMAASTLAINPIMYKKVPYDPLRDFAPITRVELAATAHRTRSPALLERPTSPAGPPAAQPADRGTAPGGGVPVGGEAAVKGPNLLTRRPRAMAGKLSALVTASARSFPA